MQHGHVVLGRTGRDFRLDAVAVAERNVAQLREHDPGVGIGSNKLCADRVSSSCAIRGARRDKATQPCEGEGCLARATYIPHLDRGDRIATTSGAALSVCGGQAAGSVPDGATSAAIACEPALSPKKQTRLAAICTVSSPWRENLFWRNGFHGRETSSTPCRRQSQGRTVRSIRSGVKSSKTGGAKSPSRHWVSRLPWKKKKKWDPDFIKRKKIKAVLDTLIPRFSVRLGRATSIDVTRQGVDKAYGIRKLRDILEIPIDQMVFIGDALFPGGNDYPAKQAGALSIEIKDPHETKRVIEAIVACLAEDDG